MSVFDIFKKKEIQSVDELAAEPAEKEVNFDNIAIHSMPAAYRLHPAKASSAKTMGLFIIGGGIVVLILASFGLYYFLFWQPAPAPEITAPESELTAQESAETEPEPNQATSTPLTGLPSELTEATSTATTTPENLNQPASYTPGGDVDADNLTDKEEVLLGTATSSPDTDGDGYVDGAELVSLYDPLSKGKLADNPNIGNYENKTFNYGVLYPKKWNLSTNGGDDSVMFTSGDNQFIQIIIQPNANKQTLDQWYIEQVGVTSVNETDRVIGNGWQGIKNPNGLTLYLVGPKNDYIFTLTYNPGADNVLDYIDIFRMMMKSFAIKI